MILYIKEFIKPFFLHIKFTKHMYSFRKRNKHNSIFPQNVFNVDSVKAGKHSYGKIRVIDYGKNDRVLSIGNYCSLAENVVFILSGEHDYKVFSTFPFKTVYKLDKKETQSKGDIIVEDDVWIGYGCIILSGVTIGKGAVIAAGSVVSKDVPPYAIYINGECKKYRFEEEVIRRLKELDFGKFEYNPLLNRDIFDTHVTVDNVDNILKALDEVCK